MSDRATLTRQINNCLHLLQHSGRRRQQMQAALLHRLQIPLVLLGGFCLGLLLQSGASNKAARPGRPGQLAFWLWTLWHHWKPATPAAPVPSDHRQ